MLEHGCRLIYAGVPAFLDCSVFLASTLLLQAGGPS